MRRFTVLELMVVLAVLATLAALGLPAFYEAQLKARRSEVPLVLDGLKSSQVAYYSSNDGFAMQTSTPHPSSAPGKQKRPWNDGTIPLQFTGLGFEPDGDVYGQYRMPGVIVTGELQLSIQGMSNLDAVNPPYVEMWRTPFDFSLASWTHIVTCPSCF